MNPHALWTAADIPKLLHDLQTGRISETLAACNCLLFREPNNPAVQHLMGLVRAAEGRFELAIDHLSRAAQADSSNGVFHYDLGVCFARVGRTNDAIEFLMSAAELAPFIFEPNLYLAKELTRARRYVLAESVARRAVSLSPASWEAHAELGGALRKQRRLTDAVHAYQQAIRLAPQPDATTLSFVALVLEHLGRTEEAVSHHRRAAMAKRDVPWLYSNYLYSLRYSSADDFVDFFQKLGTRLFGQYKWQPLPADSAIFREQFVSAKWHEKPSVLALSNGARVLMVLLPHNGRGGDYGRHWQQTLYRDYEDSFELMDNLFLYAIDKGQAYLIADVDGKLERHDPVFHLTHGLTNGGRAERVNPRRYGERTWFDEAAHKFAVFDRKQVRAIVSYSTLKRDRSEFQRDTIDQALTNYWSQRVEESAG